MKNSKIKKKQGFFSKIKRLFSGSNTTVFDMLEEHVTLSYSAAKLLDKMVHNMCFGSSDNKEIIKNIIKIERKDDEIATKINFEIYEGRLLPYTSEDWFNLADEIDDLTDIAEIAARSFGCSDIKVPVNIRNDLMGMSDKMLATVCMLVGAVSFMKKDLSKARESAMRIDEQREKVRDYEFKIISNLSKSKINPVYFVQIKDFIVHLGKLADKAESISDRIAAMSVKYNF